METGFSSMASVTVQRKLLELKEALTDDNPIKYVQRIDNVLFSHGGVSDFFVKECVNASLYNNVDSVVDEIAYLVGVALSNAIGEDVGMFIEKNIFEPLHITKYEYGRCSEGYFYGASLMKLTVHDLSQFFLKIMLKRQLQFNKLTKKVDMDTSSGNIVMVSVLMENGNKNATFCHKEIWEDYKNCQ